MQNAKDVFNRSRENEAWYLEYLRTKEREVEDWDWQDSDGEGECVPVVKVKTPWEIPGGNNYWNLPENPRESEQWSPGEWVAWRQQQATPPSYWDHRVEWAKICHQNFYNARAQVEEQFLKNMSIEDFNKNFSFFYSYGFHVCKGYKI